MFPAVVTSNVLKEFPHTIETDTFVYPMHKVFNLTNINIRVPRDYFLTGIVVKFTSNKIEQDALSSIFDTCNYSFTNIGMSRKLVETNLLPGEIYPFAIAKYYGLTLIITPQHKLLLEQLEQMIDIVVIYTYVKYDEAFYNYLLSYNAMIEIPWFDNSLLLFVNGMVGCSIKCEPDKVEDKKIKFVGYEYSIDSNRAYHLLSCDYDSRQETKDCVTCSDALLCLVDKGCNIVSFDTTNKINTTCYKVNDDNIEFSFVINRNCDTISDINVLFPGDIIGNVGVSWSSSAYKGPIDFDINGNILYLKKYTMNNKYTLLTNWKENTVITITLDKSNNINNILDNGRVMYKSYFYDNELRKKLIQSSDAPFCLL